MRSFNVGSDDPWFRVGTVDVTTTIFVVGLGVISMIVWAIEGPARSVSKYLGLPAREIDAAFGGGVSTGQVWRLLTWPIPNEPDFWTIILFAIFFLLGSQLEAAMGRRLYTIYLVVLTVIPAAIVTVLDLVFPASDWVFGLNILELGVLVGFACSWPTARFWPGIPAWIIATAIVIIDFLQLSGDRLTLNIYMLLAVVAMALLLIRSMGFAEEVHWIPKMPLPANYGGEPKAFSGGSSGGSPKRSTSRRRRRSKANLSVAPAPQRRRELSRVEEAEMDAILEQVADHGLESLTPEQRTRLEEHSKRLRGRDWR